MRTRALRQSSVVVLGTVVLLLVGAPGFSQEIASTFEQLRVDKVVCIGDMTDNHAISYHEKDPDLHSHRDELLLARKKLKPWHKDFPGLEICIGNHDDLDPPAVQERGDERTRLLRAKARGVPQKTPLP